MKQFELFILAINSAFATGWEVFCQIFLGNSILTFLALLSLLVSITAIATGLEDRRLNGTSPYILINGLNCPLLLVNDTN